MFGFLHFFFFFFSFLLFLLSFLPFVSVPFPALSASCPFPLSYLLPFSSFLLLLPLFLFLSLKIIPHSIIPIKAHDRKCPVGLRVGLDCAVLHPEWNRTLLNFKHPKTLESNKWCQPSKPSLIVSRCHLILCSTLGTVDNLLTATGTCCVQTACEDFSSGSSGKSPHSQEKVWLLFFFSR